MKNALQIGVIFCGMLLAQSAFAAYHSSERYLDYRYSDDNRDMGLRRNVSTGFGVFNRGGGGVDDGSYSNGDSYSGGDMGESYVGGGSDDQCCAPCEQPCGPCYCMYVRYNPCYYNTYRCVEEPRYYTKRCCRQVPKYYQVQRCKYIPQYYCDTCCKMCPEYYDVQECTTCKKWVCDRKCKYVPQYYYKKTCAPTCAPACAAPCAPSGCPGGSCPQ